MKTRFIRSLAVSATIAFALTIFTPQVTLAAGMVDNGAVIAEDTTNPYDSARSIGNGFDTKTVFGYFDNRTNGNVDIYTFTASQDGEQTIRLAVPESERKQVEFYSLLLIDPTTENEASFASIPVPSDDYQVVNMGLTEATDQSEPLLMEKLVLVGQSRVSLVKDQTYYIVLLGPPVASERSISRYILRVGEGPLWSASELFRQPGVWLQYKLGLFGDSPVYSYTPTVLGGHLALMGLSVWAGFMAVQVILTLMAVKRRAAGYVLVKLQPISRIALPVAAWFTLLGGYLAFMGNGGLFGTSLAVTLAILPAFIVLIVEAFVTAPKLAKVDVASREATIPKRLLAALYVHGVVGAVSMIGTLALVAQWLLR
jgi:hypothetical protein